MSQQQQQNNLFQNPRHFKGHSQSFINWFQFHKIFHYFTAYTHLHDQNTHYHNNKQTWVRDTQEIVDLFSLLRSRGQLPISLHTALTFTQISLNKAQSANNSAVDNNNNNHNNNDLLVQYSLNLALIRFVNILVDALQKGFSADSVRKLGISLDLPNILIQFRHSSTHSALIDLNSIELGANLALEWIQKHYFQLQYHEANLSLYTIYRDFNELRRLLSKSENKNNNNNSSTIMGKNNPQKEIRITKNMQELISKICIILDSNPVLLSTFFIPMLTSFNPHNLIELLQYPHHEKNETLTHVFLFSLPKSLTVADSKFRFTVQRVTAVFNKLNLRYSKVLQSLDSKITGFRQYLLRECVIKLIEQIEQYQNILHNDTNQHLPHTQDELNEFQWRIELISQWIHKLLELTMDNCREIYLSLINLIEISLSCQKRHRAENFEIHIVLQKLLNSLLLKLTEHDVNLQKKLDKLQSLTSNIGHIGYNTRNDSTSSEDEIQSFLNTQTVYLKNNNSKKKSRFVLCDEIEWNELDYTIPLGRLRNVPLLIEPLRNTKENKHKLSSNTSSNTIVHTVAKRQKIGKDILNFNSSSNTNSTSNNEQESSNVTMDEICNSDIVYLESNNQTSVDILSGISLLQSSIHPLY